MGKMINVLLLVFIVELSVALFITGCAGTSTECGNKTSLFSWLLAPQDWNLSSLLGVVQSNVFLIGGVTAITVGTLFMKSDFLVYAGLTATLFTFGKSLYVLWQLLANVAFFGNSGSIVATIILAPLLIYTFVTMLDFARGRD